MSIAGYVIVCTTQEMDKNTSELLKLFCARSLTENIANAALIDDFNGANNGIASV